MKRLRICVATLSFFSIFYTLLQIHVSINVPTASYGKINSKEIFARENSLKAIELANISYFNSLPSSVIFTGDVLLARNVEFLMEKHGKPYPFKGIRFSSLSKNTYVVSNFEASIPEVHIPTKNMQMNFSVDTKYIRTLSDYGFTHFSLANNHSQDYGKESNSNTIKILANNNLSTFGDYEGLSDNSIQILKLKGIDIAVIGVQALTKIPESTEIKNLLKKASNLSDLQIVYIHWGEEYVEKSNSLQKKLAQEFVSAGTDLIVGHHPHVVQEIDYIDGVLVFYSLGNYIFDQYFSKEVQTGLLLELNVQNGIYVDILPIQSYEKISQPRLMKSLQKKELLSSLSMISHPRLKEHIINGSIPLNKQVATSSEMAIMVK